MTNLERVGSNYEIVREGDEAAFLQAMASEWASGASKAIWGQMRQAMAAAAFAKSYGRGWVKVFAPEVRAEKSKVYSFGRVGYVFGPLIEDGDPDFSARLESGLVSMRLLAECTRYDNPFQALEEALDEEKSARQLQAENKKEKETKQLEAAEEEGAETVEETRVCPTCHGEGEIPLD